MSVALLLPSVDSETLELRGGIGIAWLLARGSRAWPGVFLGAALSEALLVSSRGSGAASDALVIVGTASLAGLADLVSAIVAYRLAKSLLRWPVALLQAREIILFIAVVIPGGALLGTSCEFLASSIGDAGTAAPHWQELAQEFSSRMLGALVCSVVMLVIWGEPRAIWVRRRLMAVFIPIAYAGIVWGVRAIETSARHQQRAEFRELIGNAISELEIDLANHEMIASALTAFYASSNLVERGEFASFSKPLLARLPNVQAISWEPLIRAAERSAFVSAARAEGFENFGIFERNGDGQRVDAGERPEYFPIWFIEPLAGNQAALGFDLNSEPTRREAIARTRQLGRPTASAPIRLIQARNEVGVLLLAPINSNETGAFDGLVSVVVNATRICARVGDLLSSRGVHLSVTDDSAAPGQGMLYSAAGAPASGMRSREAFEIITDVHFGGRRWRTEVTSTSDYLNTTGFWGFFSQSGAFVIVLILMTGAQLYTSGRDLLVEAVVKERSQELQRANERFRMLLDAAPCALIAVSASGKMVMANREALELFGYSLDQLLGHSPDMLLARQEEHSLPAAPLVQLRDGGSLNARIVLCQSKSGEHMRLQVRQSLSKPSGEQLTVVTFQPSSDHTQGSRA